LKNSIPLISVYISREDARVFTKNVTLSPPFFSILTLRVSEKH